ncbi:MAG: hypothetical protein M3155_05330 [Actinomycetota bacterium]|nr:hypothetical protein [Actinomycetota bacterium]
MLLIILLAWAGAIALLAWALAVAAGRADREWERWARARASSRRSASNRPPAYLASTRSSFSLPRSTS